MADAKTGMIRFGEGRQEMASKLYAWGMAVGTVKNLFFPLYRVVYGWMHHACRRPDRPNSKYTHKHKQQQCWANI